MAANSKMCPLPWMSQSLRANGDVRICCQANQGPSLGILRDDAGNILNARTADLVATRNAPLLKEVRSFMMKNEWHPECKRCETETNAGMKSRLQYENEKLIGADTEAWAKLTSNTSTDGTINTSAINCSFYDLRFGNLCNLKCRICGPTDSSAWYDDYVAVNGGNSYKDAHGQVKLIINIKNRLEPEEAIYNWHESASYWQQMEARIPEIRKLYIVGGEPLLINQHYEFLQKCVDLGHAKNIEVEYNSNLTNIPNRAWNIWKNFKKIFIGASVDGAGHINDYMRYPSNFDQIHKNLKQLSVAPGNFQVWIAATISVFNILHLPEFLKWAIENKLPRINDTNSKPIITPHPLHGPEYLNIRMLPQNVKDAVVVKFTEWRPKLVEIIDTTNLSDIQKDACKKQAGEILDQFVRYMNEKDLSAQLPTFWKITRKLDDIRGQSIETSIPELFQMIKHTEPKADNL